MIRGSLKVLLFGLCFFVEVKVQASEVTWPPGCSLEDSSCTLKHSGADWRTLQLKEVRLHLAPGATVRKKSPQSYRLVKGQAFIKNQGSEVVTVSFVAGEVLLKSGAELNLEISPGQVSLQTPTTSVQVRAGGQFYTLDAGFSVEADLTELPALWAVPRALDLASQLENRAAAGLKELDLVRENWARACQEASVLSQGLVRRALASEKERQQKEKLKEEHSRREAEKMRALFRRKNHLDLL